MGLQILERKNIMWWEFVALFSKHLFCSGVLGTLELVCLIPLSDLFFSLAFVLSSPDDNQNLHGLFAAGHRVQNVGDFV